MENCFDEIVVCPLPTAQAMSMIARECIAGTIAIVIVSGCAGMTGIDPHENFIRSLHDEIGKSFPEETNPWRASRNRISGPEELPDGLMRYRQGITRLCSALFDVDPNTHIVIRVSFDGSTNECVLIP